MDTLYPSLPVVLAINRFPFILADRTAYLEEEDIPYIERIEDARISQLPVLQSIVAVTLGLHQDDLGF